MPQRRIAGFPVWFWCAAGAGSLVLASIVLQPWCDPTLLVDDLPEIADNYLDHQYHHPEGGPLHFPWLGGLLTQLDSMLFCSVAAVNWVVAGFLVRMGKRSALSGFLIWVGLLSLVLGLDEVLMFHEKAHDQFGPFAAKLFSGTYAVVLWWLIWKNRAVLRSTEWRVLLISLVCFGLSEMVANLGMLNRTRFLHLRIWAPSPERTLFEEGLKWLGCVLWFAYFADSARLELERALNVSRQDKDQTSPLAA